ncbi:LamG-like jellyroll fold domain-containing protein [Microbacterium sp. zg.Y909]|uniref:LamG-like jellyroll fold domain-containing protein n=1 Tax=Microbacterium sp. zg.Y909 TaxID=2969413 RepID=UPI00214BAC7E|nr:LamG-like jellyroll fold domain-containing protein [Microbacterium sp. zg.Y909]MCR2823961.1 DNRLRE domain-containing protein [Microbacterium sp. zg.Y909]
MRTRITAACAAILAMVIGMGAAQVLTPASALSPGVSFSAENQSTWQTNGTVYALGAASGKVIAGGTFSQIRPPEGRADAVRSRNALAIFNAETGEPDSCQFAVSLSGGTPTVRAITASPDGSTVYIGGNFSNVGGVTVSRVAALNVQTCTVLPFRAPSPSSTVSALTLKDSVLYVGGLFNSVGTQVRRSYAAFDATTGALLDWVADAVRTRTDLPPEVGQGRAIAVSPDGAKVAIGGDMFEINGQYSHSIALVSGASGPTGAGGTVLRTYPRGFIPDTSITKAIIDGGDGKFYIGNEGTGSGVFDGKAAFSWETGDQVWRDTCLGATQALVMYGGTLYSASHAHDCSGINAFNDGIRRYFMAQNPDSMEILGWLPLGNDGIGEGIGPRALVVATGATTGQQFLWSGGDFTRINGGGQQGLTRFGPQDTGNPPTPSASAQAISDGGIQVRFRSVVDADDSHLTYRIYRNNSTTPIWSGVSRSLWWERPQVTFVDRDVRPGTTYTYRVEATDGTNTSPRSSAVSATARGEATDYASQIRAGGASTYWDGTVQGSWVQDVAGTETRVDATPAMLFEGGAGTGASAIPATTGSLSFDGVDDYAVTDQLRLGPNVYSLEMWINTTTTSGGKMLGFGTGRPRTGSNAPSLSGSYDRHLYMHNDGRISFGVYTGGATTISSPQPLNDGQWHHVVATQGASGMALYVDGLRVAANPTTNAQAYWGVWRVGGDQLNGWPNRPTSNFFNGLIDEVAIYSGALPAADVARHYLAAGRELDLNDAPADAYGAAVFAADPSLYWRFDETDGTVRDASLFGTADGAYNTGAVSQDTGVVAGRSVRVAGDISSTVSMTQATGPSAAMTGEIWFQTTSTAGGKLFGFENTPTGNGNAYDKHLYMTDQGQLVWGSWIGSAATVQSPASYNDGQWHHAATVLDASGRKLYVDGELVASSSVTGGETGAGLWRVGGGNLSGWPGQPSSFYLDATLDEFAIYPATLDADTLRSHFLTGMDDDVAPTAPTALAATTTDEGVSVTWAAAQDNRGVASYSVYRGDSADFAVGEDALVGRSTGTAFLDTFAMPGTTYYKVTAVDASGNVGPSSEAVAVAIADTTAPSAPSEVSGTTTGNAAATVTWRGSADDVGVVAYDVHRGADADFTPTVQTLVGETETSPYVDSPLTPGTYHYKVIARDAAGNVSAPSDAVEVTILAPDTTAPSEPAGVEAAADGADVSLSWRPSTDDRAVAGYDVHRSAQPDFSPTPGTLVGGTEGTRFVDEALAPGTWHYRVVARDAAGNAGAPSAVVSVSVTDVTAPTAPRNLTGTAEGDDITLAWGAATDDVGVRGYAVHRGTTADFVPSAQSLLAEVTTASYVDENRPAGTSHYKVVAVDAAGNVSSPASVAVTIAAAAPVVVTLNALEDAMVLQSMPTANYGANTQLSARGAAPGQQSFLSFALPAAPAGTSLSAATLRVRTSTDASAGSVDSHAIDLLTGTWSEAAVTWNTRPTGTGTALGTLPPAPAVNTAYTAQLSPGALSGALGGTRTLRLSGAVGTDNVRLWSSEAANAGYRPVLVLEFTPLSGPDTVSPTAPVGAQATARADAVQITWQAAADNVGVVRYEVYRGGAAGFAVGQASRIAQVTDLAYIDGGLAPGAYHYRVVAFDAAGNAGPASDEVSATVSAPDTTAPTTPGVPTARVTGAGVQLDWAASSDDIAVTGYTVHRGASADFVADASSRIAETASAAHADSGLAPGTYFYKVVARDAAGNLSAPTAAVSAVVVAQPQTVTTTVPVQADAAVYATQPTQNFGANNQLASRGDSGQQSLLRLTVPELPAGASFSSVQLNYRTTTDPTAASATAHEVFLMNGDWTENTVTWNTRPTQTAGATALGTLTGATALNTSYSVALNAAQLGALSGQTVTIRIATATADNLRIFSREATTAAHRPTLTFTYVTG